MTFSFYYVLLYFSIIFFPFYLLDIRPKAKREQKLPFYQAAPAKREQKLPFYQAAPAKREKAKK
jgi:hypothetical protein